jgi:hypothetical protein
MRIRVISLVATLALAACGSGDAPETDDTAATTGQVQDAVEAEPEAAAAEPEDDVIEADALSESGHVEIKQYTVAYIGSGTLGSGTLTWRGKTHAFKIGGLGVGGVGVSSVDASGPVYNLHDLNDFTGTYGNARMGITVADKGKGKLWLKNPQGVVLKLQTQMKGLALSGGVDGIVITWEGEVSEGVREAAQETKEVADDVKDGAEKAFDSLKDRF